MSDTIIQHKEQVCILQNKIFKFFKSYTINHFFETYFLT